ncbi:MAG: hypothetical protein GY769_12375 [bacterium]|nr:hypothetical protein [bacterium]
MPSDLPNESGLSNALQARALATFERAQLLTSESSPFNLVVSLKLEGSVDRERLRGVLDVLQESHPCLAVRISGKPGTATFELARVPPIPLAVLERTRETSWIGAVESELSTGFDRATGPLMRCTLVDPDDSGEDREIVLTFHHAIVDSASAVRIIDELVELCGSEARPPSHTGESRQGLPPGADSLFPSRYRGASSFWPSCRFLAREMAGEVGYRWRTRAHRARPRFFTSSGEPARSRVLPIALSEQETDTLVRATRERRLTLNSALNAAFLLAVVRHRYPGTDLPHRYFVFPTLRPYLDPPVPEDSDGSYLTTLRLTVGATETRDVWDLASEIQGQILRADEHGGRFFATRFSAMSMKMILGQSDHRMSRLALSYTGAQPLGPRHGSLRLAELHAFVSNLPIGPEYTVQARIFRGRLWLDILYLDSDMDESEARAIAEETRRILFSPSDGEPEAASDSKESNQ